LSASPADERESDAWAGLLDEVDEIRPFDFPVEEFRRLVHRRDCTK
jgi:hypothetical protein